MAPKKASASARIVLKGHVKGAPEITSSGSAVVVTKELHEGAEVEEIFPRRRVTGKQKAGKQLIPAEDVLRTVEEASRIVARGTAGRAEKETRRQVGLVTDLANKLIGEEMQKTKKAKSAKKTATAALAAQRVANRQLKSTFREELAKQMAGTSGAAGSTDKPPPRRPPARPARPPAAGIPRRIFDPFRRGQREEYEPLATGYVPPEKRGA